MCVYIHTQSVQKKADTHTLVHQADTANCTAFNVDCLFRLNDMVFLLTSRISTRIKILVIRVFFFRCCCVRFDSIFIYEQHKSATNQTIPMNPAQKRINQFTFVARHFYHGNYYFRRMLLISLSSFINDCCNFFPIFMFRCAFSLCTSFALAKHNLSEILIRQNVTNCNIHNLLDDFE